MNKKCCSDYRVPAAPPVRACLIPRLFIILRFSKHNKILNARVRHSFAICPVYFHQIYPLHIFITFKSKHSIALCDGVDVSCPLFYKPSVFINQVVSSNGAYLWLSPQGETARESPALCQASSVSLHTNQ